MASLWLNSDGKLVVDATSGKAILCSTCPCCIPNDDFSGTGNNSGSVGDANWNARWTTVTNDGTASISGGALNLSVPAAAGTTAENYANCWDTDSSSDFTAQVDVTWTGLNVTLANNQYAQVSFVLYSSAGVYGVVVGKWPPNLSYPASGGGTGYDFQGPSISQTGGTLSPGTHTLKYVRSSGVLTGYVGANNYSFGSFGTTITGISLVLWSYGSGTTPAASAVFDNFQVT